MSAKPLTLPSRTALLIIDMQNSFCHPSGVFVQAGIQVPPSTIAAVTTKINALRTSFHAAQLPVIFISYAFSPDYSNAGILLDDFPQLKQEGFCIRGTWDAQVVEELKPDVEGKGEVVLEKWRNSAFAGATGLEGALRERGVERVVVCGCATNVCVESTVREGCGRDWRCLTVGDACAALTREDHEASLKNLEWFGGVADTAQVEEALKRL